MTPQFHDKADTVTALCERYTLLNYSQDIAVDVSEIDLDYKVHDSRLATNASSLGLRVGYLRLALSLQESPGRTGKLLSAFNNLCDQHRDLLTSIAEDGEKTQGSIAGLDEAVAAMNWYSRSMPGFLLGDRAQRIGAEAAAEKLKRTRQKQQGVEQKDIAEAKQLEQLARQAIGQSDQLALVYWRDELGEHSYYVDSLPFEVREGRPVEVTSNPSDLQST